MPHCNKQMISFFLTTKCNLCCRYCYNAKERNAIEEQTLSLEIAKAGLDMFFAENPSRHIRFYGPGEPTQEFAVMKAITEYAKQVGGDSVTSEIQTNGVFTEEIRTWVLDNINIVWMSFDGPPDIQNYNRPLNPKYKATFGNKTSAEVLENNVRWLIGNKGSHNIMIGARITITEKNIERQREMVDYFFDLGIRYVWTDPIFPSVGQKALCYDASRAGQYEFDMPKYIDYYLDAYHYAEKKGMFWGSFLAVNFDGVSEFHCRACTPVPHITTDGYLSACDMALSGENAYHMGLFIYGKYNYETKSFDIDFEKIRALKERKSTRISHCNNCEAKLHCGGYCLGEVVNETGRLDGQKPNNCFAVRRLLKELGVTNPYKYLHP